MDRWKAEGVAYHFGIWDFRSFSQSKAKRLRSVVPLFYLETEFNSNVNC
jgi:hypothetical protein